MEALHEVIERDGTKLDVLACPESGLRLEVARTGAEMISLQKTTDGAEPLRYFFRDGQCTPPPQGWANHATVMGYFLHRLWKEQSQYRDQVITGGNHGFLRHFVFEPPDFFSAEGSLTYRVPVSKIPPDAYPLKVSLALSYRFQPEGNLEVEFLFHNEEPELMAHLSFGLHPGFAVADPREAKVFLPAGKYIRHLAPGNFLSGETVTIEHPGGLMPFVADDLPGSFLLELSGVPHRQVVLENPEFGNRLKLDFSECPFLTIWSDLTAGFICLEPCWGLPDCNPPTRFEDKPGIQTIAPGKTLKKTFRIRPS